MADGGSRRSSGERGVVKAAGAVPLQDVSSGASTRSQVLLGPEDGAPRFAMRRFVMGEGGGMPLHTNLVEHEQYVLRGRGRVVIGEEVHVVTKGDVLFIPAGVPHSYTVLDAPFEFLCVVPNAKDEIAIVEPEGGDP